MPYFISSHPGCALEDAAQLRDYLAREDLVGLEIKLPMALLEAEEGFTFNLRFVVYRDRLPVDALPQEGSLEVSVAPEEVLSEIAYESQ